MDWLRMEMVWQRVGDMAGSSHGVGWGWGVHSWAGPRWDRDVDI